MEAPNGDCSRDHKFDRGERLKPLDAGFLCARRHPKQASRKRTNKHIDKMDAQKEELE